MFLIKDDERKCPQVQCGTVLADLKLYPLSKAEKESLLRIGHHA